ncbi:MAG TPA: PHB depolymerase family esterase [Acidimicrobiales bacterium]|nr:PHB depolymerase family esterase [Acidimicrobiales bacterium]
MGIRRVASAVALALLMALATLVGVTGRAAAVTPSTRWRGTFSARLTLPAGSDAAGTWPRRNYYVYVPPSLPATGHRSLVVYLHGTTQTAIDAANGATWNDLADQERFIVVYPEEATSAESGDATDGSSDLRGWSWGRAAYETRGSGESRAIEEITQRVIASYGVDRGSVYIGGVSAGAIMSTVVAATYPDVYSAVASWAGCDYLCVDASGALGYQRMGAYARVVPTIMFAGTLDYTVNPALTGTQIPGTVEMNDLADDGLPNRSVRLVKGPTNHNLSVATLEPGPHPDVSSNGCHVTNSANNPCPAGWLDWKTYPYTVTEFGYGTQPKDVVVESWVIHGMSHNYSGGNPEGSYVDPYGPETTAPAWRFFRAHSRSRSDG